MFIITYSRQFKKDFKLVKRQPRFDLNQLDHVLNQLRQQISLEPKYRIHKLQGNFIGCYECHVQPDILLIFEVDHAERIIYLLRIGSHSELF